jgi:exodeoxyribonuclease VII large subunit
MRAVIKHGARVRLRGKPSFWVPGGRIQFIAERIEATGEGQLLAALEELKTKLAAEGLFHESRKRPLPADPRRIGVVTSAQGAVIHDIARVAFRRGPARILLSPAQVQGQGAAASVVRALARLESVNDVDVIIVGRGGGTRDDLLCFNDEAVVRAIAACSVPVVSAVGHEVDVTLTDFAADRRASTPSQAAELVVPDRMARRALLRERTQRLVRATRARLREHAHEMTRVRHARGDPRFVLAAAQQRLDEARFALGHGEQARLRSRREALRNRSAALDAKNPRVVLGESRARLARLRERIATRVRASVASAGRLLTRAASRLE